ncbi:MAG: nickel pincer cofactor biosynthesis protein LarB [Chloroflexi bacterium]|nr:nickel pincer cofactor biosynthesis protein LarB [Chloroflexota bacterium]PKB57095.1 MAG: 1-(5-phosphoribosyl)-5-amino-4-imidazole-carboxylate carboxylase [SAR202 cluster bacterium Casp-Chloro-G3]
MQSSDIRQHLIDLREGKQSVDDVLKVLRDFPYQDLDFAKLDHHRPLRTGFPEVVLGQGKTPDQVAVIVSSLSGHGHPVLVTRASPDAYKLVVRQNPDATYNQLARSIIVPGTSSLEQREGVLVLTAGTADLPVAEEATVTAELMGSKVERVNDVGVAGLHRLLDSLPTIQRAKVIVVVAGMEAAITGVLAGLVSAPVIAVPTSVGYGASFEGLAALLGMLNSCAPGVATVNIDNGFGAGYLAAQINGLNQPNSD